MQLEAAKFRKFFIDEFVFDVFLIKQFAFAYFSVKNALGSVRKRFHSENPHVAHHALMVLEALVKNCGEKVHKEIATKDYMEDMKHLANDSGDKVKDKILELIQCWSYAFREKPEYKIVNDTHNLMKLEGEIYTYLCIVLLVSNKHEIFCRRFFISTFTRK